MKSNRLGVALQVALLLCGLGLIRYQRAGLAEDFKSIRDRSDAYLLPGVEQTYLASLGYRSALADLIYGHVLVSYGIHFQEKRLFEHVGDYLDVINRLDPTFRDPYWYADTLLTLQPKVPPESFYLKAREIQERGLKALPYDQALWSSAGQFLAYLAPPQLSDPQQKAEFREAGARYLVQACNLVGSNENIPYHCVTAARLLSVQGEIGAARAFLERLQTVSDDPKIQELAASYLTQLSGKEAQSRAVAQRERFFARWRADLSLSPRVEANALGPDFDQAACAGLLRADRGDCASSWRSWAASDGSSAP